jgi:hypothetical protein
VVRLTHVPEGKQQRSDATVKKTGASGHVPVRSSGDLTRPVTFERTRSCVRSPMIRRGVASGHISRELLHDRTRPIILDRRVRSSQTGVSDQHRSARLVSQYRFLFSTVTTDRRVRSYRQARPVSARLAVSKGNGWIYLRGLYIQPLHLF